MMRRTMVGSVVYVVMGLLQEAPPIAPLMRSPQDLL